MVMALQVVATEGRDGVQLMVRGIWESLTRGHAGAVEFIVGIVHLITTEHSFQTAFIKNLVVCHKRQALYQWCYLRPHFR